MTMGEGGGRLLAAGGGCFLARHGCPGPPLLVEAHPAVPWRHRYPREACRHERDAASMRRTARRTQSHPPARACAAWLGAERENGQGM